MATNPTSDIDPGYEGSAPHPKLPPRDNPATLPFNWRPRKRTWGDRHRRLFDWREVEETPSSPPPSPEQPEQTQERKAEGVPLARETFSRLAHRAKKLVLYPSGARFRLYRQLFRELPVAANCEERYYVTRIAAYLIVGKRRLQERRLRRHLRCLAI